MGQPTGTFLLVLYCSAGGGHQRVGEAIAQEWKARTGGRAEILNYFARFVNPLFDAVTTFCYFQAVQYAPKVCGRFYDLMGRIHPDSRFRRAINRTGMRRFERYLARERPDVVCCVHCTPAGTMSDLHAAGRTSVPCVTVITDYVNHSQWTHPHVDRYCVPNSLVRDGLIARGILPERIVVSGLPINLKFQRPVDRVAVLARLGLVPGVPVVLVMAGAYAMLGGVLDVVRVLAELPHPIQVVVVCGYDRRLAARARARAAGARHPVRVFGYVDDVEELMTVTDLLITKAGGITVSEALAKHLPMLIYRPIPGQEEGNTRFLVSHGAALAPRTPAQLRTMLEDLLVHPDRLAAMRQAAAALARPDAVRIVTAHLASLARGSAGAPPPPPALTASSPAP